MSLGTSLEKVWYQKSLGIGSVQIFWYRQTLLGRLLLKARTGNSQQLARRLAFLGEIGNFKLSFSVEHKTVKKTTAERLRLITGSPRLIGD